MTYELTLELKNAGFPQSTPKKAYCVSCEKWKEMDCLRERHTTDYLATPTLEELIEACGEGRFQLERVEGTWLALKAVNNALCSGQGPTPLIASAKLWLALNKK